MSHAPLTEKVLRGAVAMLLLRWVVRFLGLISVFITARLLTPEDFGVMGTASLVVGSLITLKTFGGGEVLVRLPTLERAHIHTVWTLQLLLSLPPALAIYFLAAPASGWLNEPRVADVLHWLALVPVIEAFASPAPTLLARDMNFNRLFYLRVAVKFLSVACTIALAVALRDYWALVYGQLAASVALVVVTHYFWPYLPSLSFARLRETGSFTFWSFWRNIVVYLADSVDEFLVRRATGTEQFSHYHTSRDLARVFIAELVVQAAMPLFSAFSKIQHEPERLRKAATTAFGASVILLVPIALTNYATAHSLIRLVLGPQWDSAAPFFQFLGLGVAAMALAEMARGVYATLDKQHLSVAVYAARALVVLVAVAAALATSGTLLVAETFAAVNAVLTFLELWLIFRLLGGAYPVLALYRGPLIAGLAMLPAMAALPDALRVWPIVDIVVRSTVGGVVYLLVLLALWRLLGRPDGPERALLDRLPTRYRRYLAG